MTLQSRTKLKMNSYDPDTSPPPTDWLGTDEGERIELVTSYHRQKKIKLANLQLHAAIHVAVENQLGGQNWGRSFCSLRFRKNSA